MYEKKTVVHGDYCGRCWCWNALEILVSKVCTSYTGFKIEKGWWWVPRETERQDNGAYRRKVLMRRVLFLQFGTHRRVVLLENMTTLV